jgi:uncharacterized protein YchJ
LSRGTKSGHARGDVIQKQLVGSCQSTNQLAGFHIMARPTGPICNLDCKYCFYLEKKNLYPHASDCAPGRNDPCVCGSGKKYKRCCGRRGDSPAEL